MQCNKAKCAWLRPSLFMCPSRWNDGMVDDEDKRWDYRDETSIHIVHNLIYTSSRIPSIIPPLSLPFFLLQSPLLRHLPLLLRTTVQCILGERRFDRGSSNFLYLITRKETRNCQDMNEHHYRWYRKVTAQPGIPQPPRHRSHYVGRERAWLRHQGDTPTGTHSFQNKIYTAYTTLTSSNMHMLTMIHE